YEHAHPQQLPQIKTSDILRPSHADEVTDYQKRDERRPKEAYHKLNYGPTESAAKDESQEKNENGHVRSTRKSVTRACGLPKRRVENRYPNAGAHRGDQNHGVNKMFHQRKVRKAAYSETPHWRPLSATPRLGRPASNRDA